MRAGTLRSGPVAVCSVAAPVACFIAALACATVKDASGQSGSIVGEVEGGATLDALFDPTGPPDRAVAAAFLPLFGVGATVGPIGEARLTRSAERWQPGGLLGAALQGRRGRLRYALGAGLGVLARGDDWPIETVVDGALGLGAGPVDLDLSLRTTGVSGHAATFRDGGFSGVDTTGVSDVSVLSEASAGVPAQGYTDVILTGRVALGPVGLSAGIGTRVGWRDTRGEWWGSGEASLDVSQRLAIALGGGSAPSLPDQAVGRTGFVRLGVKVYRGGAGGRLQATPAGSDLTLLDDGRYRFRIRADAEHSVVLRGDPTDWRPVQLTSARDGWFVDLRLDPGLHRVNVSIDAGPWIPPPGLPVDVDEFGGEVGLLLVER